MAFISATPVIAPNARFARTACAVRPASHSTFNGARATIRAAPKVSSTGPRMEFEISEGVPFNLNVTIVALALAGWIIPSSIPSSIPLTNGSGLSQAFFASMQTNLANFPKGPAGDDPFWLLMFLWHVGLFACLIFGTIGINSRNQPKA